VILDDFEFLIFFYFLFFYFLFFFLFDDFWVISVTRIQWVFCFNLLLETK
jgi:hypothetical protein